MTFWNDLRFAGRMLCKSPGFAITAVVTMALGCGATTAVFSVCDGMLWKPVPLPDLASLVMILQQEPGDPHDFAPTTPGDTADLRRELTSLTGLASWEDGLANLVGAGGEPERVSQYLVTSNFFDVIGVRLALGRGFLPGEDQPGRHREVVLSDAVWRRRFGADPNLVGRTIRLDDEDFLVVGITAPKFAFPKAAEVWTPLALDPEDGASRRRQILISAGRLNPGITIQQLSADLDGVGRRLEERYPTTNHKRRFMAWSAHRFLIGEYNREYLTMLLASVLFVLLIACVNVANLQFARATGRMREVAVRSALGAGRGQIVAQLITESLLLSIAGAGLGLLLAAWGLDLIRAGMPPEVEKYIVGWKEIQLDVRAMLFTLAAAIGSGVLAGLAPAWQSSRPNLVDESARRRRTRCPSASLSRNRLRNFLVAAEVALAVVLLVGASLMVRGFNRTIRAGQGACSPNRCLTLRLALTESRYKPVPQRIAFYEDVLGRLNAIPGVQSAVAAVTMPCSDHSSWRTFTVDGRPVDPSAVPSANYQAVTPRYFETLHVPLLAGRFLDARDGRDAPRAAVISRRLAQRYWPNEPFPLGKRIRIGAPEQKLDGEPWITIVGVVGDVLHDVYDREPRAVLYVPYPQDPWLWMDIGIRTAGDPNRIVPAVRAAIAAVDPSQPVTSVATLETLIHNQALGLIYVAVLMAVFGGLALVLSCVGVYGVMAYMVQEQTHEIGIRVALGAPRENVLAMVFRRGMLTTAAGLAFGLAASYGLALLLQHLIQGVSATDPLTFAGIPLVLLAAAALRHLHPCQARHDDRPDRRPSLRVSLVLHRAHPIAFRIVEIAARAHRRNREFRHADFPAGRFDGADRLVDIVDADGAFETDRPLPFHRFAPRVHSAQDAGILRVAGVNQVEAGRPPGLESPAEYRFVELSPTAEIVHVDREERDVARHRVNLTRRLEGASCAKVTNNVASASSSAPDDRARAVSDRALARHPILRRLPHARTCPSLAPVALRHFGRDDGLHRPLELDHPAREGCLHSRGMPAFHAHVG